MDVVYTWWSCLFVLLLNENAKKEEKKGGFRKRYYEMNAPEVGNEFSKLKLKGIWSCQQMNGSLREKNIN